MKSLQFDSKHDHHEHHHVPLLILFLALLSGLAIAYVNARSNWGSTGIVVGLIFISAALLSFINTRYAWLWALLIGIWVPLTSVLTNSNYNALLALAFAYFGAFLGFFVKKFIS